MPSIASRTSYISWLAARLANRRNFVQDLVRQLTDMGPTSGLKPALYNKFLLMLSEIAGAKNEEIHLIARIEAIEQKHRFLRIGKRLRLAVPRRKKAETGFRYKDNCANEPKRPAFSLFWLIVIWFFLLRQKRNQKKQGLTAD